MKRGIIVAITAAFFFAGCVKEPQYIVFPHQGPQGEPYSTSIFVATDRHEAGGGNNLSAMLQIITANQNVAAPQMVLLGGDYVGRGPDHGETGQPTFSVEDIRSEVFRVMDAGHTELLLTYGSHDRGCTEGYNVFFSGPHRCDGYYVYGISYAQMVFATDSLAQVAIDLYLEQGDDTTSTPPPPPPTDSTTADTVPPHPSGPKAYNGIDVAEPFGISAESATRRFTAWVNSLSDDAPIVVMSHVPIHAQRGDNQGGEDWFNALQNAARKHDVILLFGHNHTLEERGDLIDQAVYLLVPGDSISVQGDSSAGLQRHKMNFIYANAGYLKLGCSSLITFIDSQGSGQYDKVSIRRYSLDGTGLQSFGTTRYRNPYTVSLRHGMHSQNPR